MVNTPFFVVDFLQNMLLCYTRLLPYLSYRLCKSTGTHVFQEHFKNPTVLRELVSVGCLNMQRSRALL